MSVTPSGSDQIPTVLLQSLNQLPDFHILYSIPIHLHPDRITTKLSGHQTQSEAAGLVIHWSALLYVK